MKMIIQTSAVPISSKASSLASESTNDYLGSSHSRYNMIMASIYSSGSYSFISFCWSSDLSCGLNVY